ncbi:MAG: hypothetical protein J3R72DRAFT_461446 [Linnemannia gamsii]|nr:MAG: hypothetical protein J3R72DRAFT_461446 [Linnemannia gamsii]
MYFFLIVFYPCFLLPQWALCTFRFWLFVFSLVPDIKNGQAEQGRDRDPIKEVCLTRTVPCLFLRHEYRYSMLNETPLGCS